MKLITVQCVGGRILTFNASAFISIGQIGNRAFISLLGDDPDGYEIPLADVERVLAELGEN